MDFHYTVATNKSIDETIIVLEQNLKEHRFGILWQLDLPAKLQEKGGYFLPCKMVIYEAVGKTMIGMPKPTSLLFILDDAELKEIARRVEETLIRVIDLSK